MPRRRKGTVSVVTSGDAYIARPDGSVEWLNRRPHRYDYGTQGVVKRVFKHASDILEREAAAP